MYYEEKRDKDGTWYWKGTPDGPWHEFTAKQYMRKCNELKDQLEGACV